MKMINLIQSLAKFGMNSDGCQRMKELCSKLGNPQQELQFIHIGGTNGKGSTCHMVSSVLIEQGYKVGVYISPALYKFNERITINNEPIKDDELEKYFPTFSQALTKFKNHPLGVPTEFEVVTALAFQYFADQKVDYVVLEVGLGGRFDATNVVIPEVSVITNIDLDHTDILGDTVEEIAFEKAGIIKENVPIIIGQMDESAEKVIVTQAHMKHSKPYFAKNVKIQKSEVVKLKQSFIYKDEQYQLGLLGKHQLENVRLVLLLFEVLQDKIKVNNNAIKEGLKKASWPGRFEIMSVDGKTIVLDVAHNPQSMGILIENLNLLFESEAITLVLGIFKDKDVSNMLSYLVKEKHALVLTKPLSDRGLESEALWKLATEQGLSVLTQEDNLEAALESALNTTNNIICICGSFNTVGPLRNYLLERV